MLRELARCLVLMLLWGTVVGGGPQRAHAQAQAQALAEPAAAGAAIVAVELECAAPIDREELLRIMPVRPGDTLDAATLDQVRQRLLQTDLFSQIAVETQPRPGGVAVIAHLVRKSVINRIRFDGNHEIGDLDLQRAARVHEAAMLPDDWQESMATRLRDRYVSEGFEAARVTVDAPLRSPGEVDLNFQINEGPPLRITAIAIVGVLPVPEADVRHAIDLAVGDRYTRARQRRAQAAIIRLFRQQRYYEIEVSSAWEHAADSAGVLRFTIAAGPLFTVHFSGNHALSDTKLLGLMELETRPIVTDGTWRVLARRAQRAYQEDGYSFARVTLRIEPGPPKLVEFTVQEGERYHIAAVHFEGNHGLTAGQLLGQMATHPPSWIPWRRGFFLDDVFDDDLKRLWYFYRRQGFASAQIVDARTQPDGARGEILVTVVVEEGPRTIVRQIDTDGTQPLGDKRPALHVIVGQPLDPETVETDRRALVNALAQAGYTRAVVQATVTTTPENDAVAAVVRFQAKPGERQHVGTIIVQDNIDTRARVITRELSFKRGDPLSPDALLQGQGNIYRLGLFRSVTVRPAEATADAPVTDVLVNVSEKPAGTFVWGGGYNTRDGIRGFGEVGYSNLQGLARRLSLRGEFNFDPTSTNSNEYIANLGFREPRLDGTRWTFRSNLLAQRSTRSVDQFSLERYAFIPAVERTLWTGAQVGSELGVEQSQVFDVKPDVLAFNPADEGRLRTISLGPFAIFDQRDDVFVPSRGTYELLRVKFAPSALGSDVPFIKVTGEHSHYIPLFDGVSFVYAMRGGWALAYEGSDQVPIRERFFLGGRTTVRGFPENEIGPEGSQGHPVGGDVVADVNTELRFPLVYGLGGVLFVDGGGVYLQHCPSGVGLQRCAHSLENFRRSADLGVRYLTPVGPISVEYGFKLDQRSGEAIGEAHFSIGNIF